MVVGQPGGESLDAGGITLIQRQVLDARVRLNDRLQGFEATARDDDVVAQSVECLSQAPANSGAASGDQNGVAGQLHALSLSVAF